MHRYTNIWLNIITHDNIEEAIVNASRNKRHRPEVVVVLENMEYYISNILHMLTTNDYVVSPYRYFSITDGGKIRDIATLPFYPDKIIQWAIMLQIEPIFLRGFCNHVCASIPGKGIQYAVKLMKKYLKNPQKSKYCLKLDICKFYPSVNKEKLKSLLRHKFKDNSLLYLLDKIIDSYPQPGLPIGSYVSQFLANFYLDEFDHWLKETMKIDYVVRYMDDIVIIHHDKDFLHQLRKDIDGYLQSLSLSIKNNWQVFDIDSRLVDFVGYRFGHGFTLLRNRVKRNMIKKLTSPTANKSTVSSYAGWLQHCDGFHLYQKYIQSFSL